MGTFFRILSCSLILEKALKAKKVLGGIGSFELYRGVSCAVFISKILYSFFPKFYKVDIKSVCVNCKICKLVYFSDIFGVNLAPFGTTGLWITYIFYFYCFLLN